MHDSITNLEGMIVVLDSICSLIQCACLGTWWRTAHTRFTEKQGKFDRTFPARPLSTLDAGTPYIKGGNYRDVHDVDIRRSGLVSTFHVL